MAIGIDLVKIDRIRDLMKHDQFLDRLFTGREQKAMKTGRIDRIAGSFAAKEAVSKLLGTGIGRLAFKDMEILREASGKPYLVLSEEGRKLLEACGLNRIELSISHEEDYALAVAWAGENSSLLSRRPELIDEELILSLLKRDRQGYKSQYGKVAIVGSSPGMAGSVCMAARAAFRVGAGLVYVIVPKSLAKIIQVKLTEAIVIAIEDDKKGFFIPAYAKIAIEAIQECDSVAIGPGMGRSSGLSAWLASVLDQCKLPTVLDADALYALAEDQDQLQEAVQGAVITPHEQEMSRLSGYSLSEIRSNRIGVAVEMANRFKVQVLLKGAETVITDGTDYYLNRTGNPGMATAGSGDVLTGMLAGLLGYGYKPITAVRLAAYIHGLAGDFAMEDKGEDGLIAGDLIEQISYVVKELRKLAEGIRLS